MHANKTPEIRLKLAIAEFFENRNESKENSLHIEFKDLGFKSDDISVDVRINKVLSQIKEIESFNIYGRMYEEALEIIFKKRSVLIDE